MEERVHKSIMRWVGKKMASQDKDVAHKSQKKSQKSDKKDSDEKLQEKAYQKDEKFASRNPSDSKASAKLLDIAEIDDLLNESEPKVGNCQDIE